MPQNVKLVMIFFALLDVLLVLTEPLRTAIIQIRKPTAVEGETIEFTCVISSVHGEQPENKEMNWFHLYKNREKIRSLPEPGGMAAVTFIKQDIRKDDIGNYTCMYGKENPGDVNNISHGSSVYLNVQELSYQLILQLDKHNQMEGMDVSFKCMISAELRDAVGKEDFFHLYKDGSLVDSQANPKDLPGVTFSIKNVKRSDTGNYTCVYGKEKLVNSANSKRSHPVYLHVAESSYQLTLQLDKNKPMEGKDVSFKCMIPAELRKATRKEGIFNLYKNGSCVDSQPHPKGISGVTFSIKKVKRSDTGNYTCVYAEEKLVNSANSKRSRPVYLHVTEYLTTPSQQKLTGDLTTPTTSIKIQQTDGIGSVPALYLGAGVGCGVLVLLLLLIGGVLKCLQSKPDPVVQTDPVYATVNQPKQPSKQQDDTLTYSEINTARVTKKKPSSAPDEVNVTYATVKTSTY